MDVVDDFRCDVIVGAEVQEGLLETAVAPQLLQTADFRSAFGNGGDATTKMRWQTDCSSAHHRTQSFSALRPQPVLVQDPPRLERRALARLIGQTSAMRVLVSSFPAIGHVHPMVPLSQSFAARGDDVLWATGPDAGPIVDSAGLRSVAVGVGAAEMRHTFFERFPEAHTLRPDQLPGFMFPHLFGSVAAPATLPDLLAVSQSWHPDVIVHGAGSLAAPIVAALVRVPNVCVGYGTLVAPERVAAAADAVAPLWAESGLEPRPWAGCYDNLYIDIYPPSLRSGPSNHVPHQQSMRPVTFSADVMSDGLDGRELAELAAGDRPLIYLTFGTVFNATTGPFREAVLGLVDLDARLVVTVGPHGDPTAFGALPPNVSVHRYVPQQLLLQRCSLVVSHGGSGTFLGALDHGLPQLCIPQAADQFANAHAGATTGASLTLLPHQCSRDAVRDAATRLLTEPSFRSSARRIRDELRSMPSPDDTASVVERLVSTHPVG